MTDPTPVSYTATTELTIGKDQTIAKAVIAGVTALGGAFATALADGAVTATEWVTVAVGTIVAAASVWAVTNEPSKKE